MTRMPNAVCSRCEMPMWSGTGSRPAEQRVCRPCRRIEPVPYGPRGESATEIVPCAACGELFERLRRRPRTGGTRKTCSQECVSRLQREGRDRAKLALVAVDHPCKDCGQTIHTKPQVKRCEPCAKLRRIESWRGKNRRRRLQVQASSEPYTREEIAERDGYRCKLCGRKVNMRLQYPHLKAPTIDHVIPLTDGGDDTRVNVQLAHFQCNSRKGAGGQQQLALVG